MTIDRSDFENLSEQNLQDLVSAGVPENRRLEYKRDTYGRSADSRREFLKDISALANAQGGHLILGVSDQKGVAQELKGIGGADPDAETVRLENLARDGLQPRIAGIRVKAVQLADGRHTIVIRVPKSWNSPHRVIAQNSNRFYVRNSAGTEEPDVYQLRALFEQSGSAIELASAFRDERVDVVRRPTGIHLLAPGRLILHLVPVASLHGLLTIDVLKAHELGEKFRPLFTPPGGKPNYNFQGLIFRVGFSGNRYRYAQLFRDGKLEAAHGGLIVAHPNRRVTSGQAIEREVFAGLPRFIDTLRDLDVPPPLVVMLTLEGFKDVRYVTHADTMGEHGGQLPEDLMCLPTCVIEDYGDKIDYHRAIKSAFDALWNSFGEPEDAFFNAAGLWVDPQNPE